MATSTKKDNRVRFKSSVGVPDESRPRLVDHLNQMLADISDLRSQVKQAHWNVKGEHFYQLHLLFDEIAGELNDFVDEIAERAVALGGIARGTVRMAAESSRLAEYTTPVDGMDHVRALVERVGQFANALREGIDEVDELGDKTTADLYTEVSRDVDKRLWFLEAHLQGGE